MVRRYDAATTPAATLQVKEVHVVDRAGHVFATDQDGTFVVYGPTGRLSALPNRHTVAIEVNRDGSRIAQLTEDGVHVDDMAGNALCAPRCLSNNT